MPVPNQTQRNQRYYTVLKATAANQLGIPSPIEWEVEGQGRAAILIARIDDATLPDTPLPGITQVTERRILTPFEDIRQQWFSSFPPEIFDRLTISFDIDNIIFDLNLEE